uniref:Ig-like domain-containing protein n=1 Tax=Astyanax mexicanus TaxID=7994 RepID=A0A3B1J7Q7_ASTMX
MGLYNGLPSLMEHCLSAYTLTQEKSMSVTLKSTVKILCTAEDDNKYISWYQQKAGAGPQFLLRNDMRANNLPSRFTYTDSGNQDYLNINGIEAEDEATYYCGRISNTTFGQGTTVVISNRPASPPSVVLLSPSQGGSSGGEVSVVCVLQGFYPDSVTLSWAEDGRAVAGSEVQTGPSRRRADGTLSQSSVLKLSAGRWSSGHAFTCRVTHPALTSPLTKSTSAAQCS